MSTQPSRNKGLLATAKAIMPDGGSKRLAIGAVLAVAGLGIGGAVVLGGGRSNPSGVEASRVAPPPMVDATPGGSAETPHYRGLVLTQAQRDAEAAQASGRTYTPPMLAAEPARIPEPPAASETQLRPSEPEPVMQSPNRMPTGARFQQVSGQVQMQPSPAEAAANEAERQRAQLLAQQMQILMGQWGSVRAESTVFIENQRGLQRGGAQPGGAPAQSAPGSFAVAQAGGGLPATSAGAQIAQSGGAGGAGSTQAGAGATGPSAWSAPAATAGIAIPAGRIGYAETVTTTVSTQPGPVVATLLSGPLQGARMIGAWERGQGSSPAGGDRMVVRFNSIALADGRTAAVEAYAVAPDTAETAIASSVDHHYVERFVVPIAAAFVRGFGEAVARSGTVVTQSPFGSTTVSQGELSTRQQLFSAAGMAGATAAGIIDEQRPRGPTVRIDAKTPIGVLFLRPVADPG